MQSEIEIQEEENHRRNQRSYSDHTTRNSEMSKGAEMKRKEELVENQKKSSKSFLPLFKRRKSIVDEVQVPESQNQPNPSSSPHSGSPNSSPKPQSGKMSPIAAFFFGSSSTSNSTPSSTPPPLSSSAAAHRAQQLEEKQMKKSNSAPTDKILKHSSSSSSTVGLGSGVLQPQPSQGTSPSPIPSSGFTRQEGYHFLSQLLGRKKDEQVLQMFIQHCEKNYCIELIHCYDAIMDYRNPSVTSGEHIQLMGKKIYERYLRRGSNEEVNVHQDIVTEIQQAIMERSLQRDSFDHVMAEIRPLLLQQLVLLQTGPQREAFQLLTM